MATYEKRRDYWRRKPPIIRCAGTLLLFCCCHVDAENYSMVHVFLLVCPYFSAAEWLSLTGKGGRGGREMFFEEDHEIFCIMIGWRRAPLLRIARY